MSNLERTETAFTYSYSPEENKEIQEICRKYLPKSESKLDELKRLDAQVQKSGIVEALCVGITGCLNFGTFCRVVSRITTGTFVARYFWYLATRRCGGIKTGQIMCAYFTEHQCGIIRCGFDDGLSRQGLYLSGIFDLCHCAVYVLYNNSCHCGINETARTQQSDSRNYQYD